MGDLIAIVIWLIFTVVSIFIPPLSEILIIRVTFALPIILFIPGYGLIAALFPKKGDLEMIERIALSFGLSIAIVPLIGLILNYTPWGIRLIPIITSLVIFAIVMVNAAWIRRVLVAPRERYRIPLQQTIAGMKEVFFADNISRMDRILNIVFLIVIVVTVAMTIYVIVVPKEGEKFTEFYILGENGMAKDYPRDIVMGKEYGVIIGVGNHEYRNISYTIECYLMNLTFDPVTNSSTVQSLIPIDRFSLSVPYNTTIEQHWNFTVPTLGFNRLEFLLFNETVPNDTITRFDRINASYRDLYLWIDIHPSG